MVAFPRAVIVFCNLNHCFTTFSLTFPSALLKLSNVKLNTIFFPEPCPFFCLLSFHLTVDFTKEVSEILGVY